METNMILMEQKLCRCLTEYMLKEHFSDRKEMATALGVDLREMDEMQPSDLVAYIFSYCAARHIPLDDVIAQMAK